MRKKCETCDFYSRSSTCHRFPPQFSAVECGFSTEKLYKFPKVKSYDWCGEYKEKEK